MTDRLAACSWSGGKDSCFALYEALSQGIKVRHLVNFVSEDFRRVRFHGIRAEMIRAQANAIGMNLVQRETTAESYEKEFREAAGALARDGVGWMICGDIHLANSRKWVETVCADIGLKVIEPLWGRSSEEILAEFMNLGFEATVVSVQADILDESWIGRKIDEKFLQDIRTIEGIDICGENGEYHTLVTGGPIFERKIRIGESKLIRKDTHWFLDILSQG